MGLKLGRSFAFASMLLGSGCAMNVDGNMAPVIDCSKLSVNATMRGAVVSKDFMLKDQCLYDIGQMPADSTIYDHLNVWGPIPDTWTSTTHLKGCFGESVQVMIEAEQHIMTRGYADLPAAKRKCERDIKVRWPDLPSLK